MAFWVTSEALPSSQPSIIQAIDATMKMMNPVNAGVAGTIAEVCAENAALVEYGAPLFRVRR